MLKPKRARIPSPGMLGRRSLLVAIPCLTEQQKFHFRTRRQELNSVEGSELQFPLHPLVSHV